MRPGLPVLGLQGVIRTEVSLTEGPSAKRVGKPRETTSIWARVAYRVPRQEKLRATVKYWATGMVL